MGRVWSIARYPVKSMAGEAVQSTWLNEAGLKRDRLYAFESSGAPNGMLRVTGRQRRELLRYRAELTADGSAQVSVGDVGYAVEDSALLGLLRKELPEAGTLRLTQETTPQTDVRPLSLISVQTIARLSEEMGQDLDPRRFRANVYLDLAGGAFAEDALVGRTLRIGASAEVLIRERDPRCRFITYDPDEPQREPLFGLMKLLDLRHEGRAGVYASVVTPGQIATGDPIALVAD